MRVRVVWVMAALLISFVVAGPSQAQVTNLITNGGFESGQIAPYGTYSTAPATATATVVTDCAGANAPEGPIEGRYCLHIVVAAAGTNNWDAGMTQATLTWQNGKKYTFSAFVKVKKGTLQFRLKPEHSGGNYEDYGSQVFTATEKWVEYHVTTAVLDATALSPGSPTFHFAFAAGDFWIDDVKVYLGDYVPTVVKSHPVATNPTPADKATDVPRDVTLGWKAGPYAATHNVYFGTVFADVNSADATKAASAGQAGTTFKPVAALDYGKTYYWRVDEVNAAPSGTIFKGDVWSFTVEPYSYPIANITATASSAQLNMGAQNTVNGSGLDASGLHGTDGNTMWLSTGALPNWIQYQFDSVYKLDKMPVWNSNQLIESLMGFGAKDVKVEYSTDGTTWTALANVPRFAQAPGAAGYAANTTVDFAGAMAKYVKLTINSTWGVLPIAGLSEVQFSYVPVVARAPQPATNATGVSLNASLDWRPGRDVTSQQVYFGSDKTAVTNGTATAQTVTDHGFTPSAMDFGTDYYWKVDEIGTATYPGSVWSFTTQEFAVVDDFESYNDQTGSTIYDTWVDGLGGNGTGSQVGYLQAPFAEQTIIHGGKQSMPFEYNNVQAPYYSEATRTFDQTQDWTAGGATTLSLYFQGYPALASVAVTETGGKMTLTGDGTDIWNNSDDFTYAYKTLTGDGSIVARVVSIGAGTNTWAKGGVMIRNATSGGSTFANMVLTANSDGTAGNGASFQYRLAANGGCGNTDSTAAIKPPYWVKVQRIGNSLMGYVSANGTTWTQMGTTQTIAMSGPVCIGICVTAHQAGEQRTFQFDGIATTGTVSSTWQGAAINSPQYNMAAPLYVTVEDKAGKKKTVVNPDAAAVTKNTWAQWKIALSDLTGVNLAAVKKLTIGVGDNVNPKPGAVGMLYIDDIAFGKPAAMVNLATNGGFETGAMAPWNAWGSAVSTVTTAVVTDCTGANVPEGPIEGNYCLYVKVSAPSTNFWDCAFNSTPIPAFVNGTKYTLSAFFKVKSGTGKVNIKPEHGGGAYEGYGETQFTITDQWAEYHVTTPVFTSDVSPMSLTFHIGFQAQEFWVDNIKFYVGDYVPSN